MDVQAGSFIDLDLSGLSSLSKSNKKLTKMVDMQKKLSSLPIVIFDHNRSATEENNISNKEQPTVVRSYLNQGTKHLEKKYPWLYDKMVDILMNKENIEAYTSDSAYFKLLGDLNGDDIDEVYLSSSARCGSSICNYRVYQIDHKYKKLREIFSEYNDFDKKPISDGKHNGWKVIRLQKCWGTPQCIDYVYRYDTNTSSYSIINSSKEVEDETYSQKKKN